VQQGLKNDLPNYDNYLELMESLKVIMYFTGFTTLLTSQKALKTAALQEQTIALSIWENI
jgi:hypothetical protein